MERDELHFDQGPWSDPHQPPITSRQQYADGNGHTMEQQQEQQQPPKSYSSSYCISTDPEILPGRRKALSGISLRAFLLGQAFGVGTIIAIYLLHRDNPLWRAPFFISTLSIFHLLEFWMTARFNTQYANVSAFLLTSNGAAYHLAHTASLIECLLTKYIFHLSTSSSSAASSSDHLIIRPWLSLSPLHIWPFPITILGLGLTILGQLTRSCAMAQAGTNFNHTVQTRRSDSHRLVTTGIYTYLRHPSYFGFFWWSLGTQIVMGNPFCLVVYAVVLWRFFAIRIKSLSLSFSITYLYFPSKLENYPLKNSAFVCDDKEESSTNESWPSIHFSFLFTIYIYIYGEGGGQVEMNWCPLCMSSSRRRTNPCSFLRSGISWLSKSNTGWHSFHTVERWVVCSQ